MRSALWGCPQTRVNNRAWSYTQRMANAARALEPTPASASESSASESNSAEVEAAYAALPEGTRAILIDGILEVMGRPKPPHVNVGTQLTIDIGAMFGRGRGGPGGWIILAEPELHLGKRPDKLSPDLAGWRRERLSELPEGAAFTLPPDWVCEILSDSTERVDRLKKSRIYAREGIGHFWILHPILRTLEVLRNVSGQWLQVAGFDLEEGDKLIRAEPFDAVELDFEALFRV